MAAQTDADYERSERNRRLSKPADWVLFDQKIGEYNRNKDFSRHELKLSGKRKMAITFGPNGWRASIWRTT